MGMDLQAATRKLTVLSRAAGFGTALFDAGGRRLMVTEDAPGAELCRAACSVKEGLSRCVDFHCGAGESAWKGGEAHIARCPFGAVSVTVAVTDGDRLAGSAAFLPLRLWDWDDAAAAELRRLELELEIANGALSAAGPTVPRVDDTRADALAALLLGAFSSGDTDDLPLRRAFDSPQKHIAALLAERRRTPAGDPEAATPRPHDYPIHLEREMLGRVRLGDKNGARAMLNELLAHIFLRSPGNMELMKARLLELVVMISRAAVESGAELERLLGLNYNFISEAAAIEDFEGLCSWVVKVLDAFLDAVYESRSLSGSRQLTDALSYIRTHHMLNLTLEDVAAQVYVSPFYLSHLFKEKLGVTFVEYLTRVRVEMAKNYLLNTQLPVTAIAEKVGYEDAGYFGKVFKRLTGVTPKSFRRGE